MGLTLNMVGGGGGGGGKAVLAVAVTNGTATSVTATKGGTSISLTYSGGIWSAELPSFGTWTVTAIDGTHSQTDTVSATIAGLYTLTLQLQDVPNGYTQLEWMKSTGTQYINSGFTPNQDTRVKTKCKIAGVGGVFGCRQNNASKQYMFIITKENFYRSDYNTTALGFPTSLTPSILIEVDKNKNVTTLTVVGGTSTSVTATYASFTCDRTMILFGVNSGSQIDPAPSELIVYYYEIYNNGTLAKKLLPAKRNSDSVVGMYDIVNDIFYTNVGTGAFVAGPAA